MYEKCQSSIANIFGILRNDVCKSICNHHFFISQIKIRAFSHNNCKYLEKFDTFLPKHIDFFCIFIIILVSITSMTYINNPPFESCELE